MSPEIIKNPYNRDALIEFIGDFLPDFKSDKRPLNTTNTKQINSAFKLGESSELELAVFELEHRGSNDKRVGLALDGFKLMKETGVYNALVIFYSKSSDAWRFSLMTTAQELKKGKVVNTFSNPRRYSYILGKNVKTATPHKFLISKGVVKDIDDLLARFSVEVVNNEFYKEIAKLYDELVGNEDIKAVLKYPETGEESHQFAVRLIGRIVFCWFLREKHSSNNIPLISKDILSRDASAKTNYYHSTLAPLFFQVLNEQIQKRSERFKVGDFGKIPYLNGGLFAPQDNDHYKFDDILEQSIPGEVDIPDSWLHKLFDLLELYHFTVDENTSVDIDLSIDPEMLGRIFENLLARINPDTGETVRRATGSFYTPREVVEFMVDHSLMEYLFAYTGIDKLKLAAMISYNLEHKKQSPLSDLEKQKIVEALSSIKILDPACGSGAFPIGVLQKIVFILQQIDPEARIWFENQIANTNPEVRQLIEREFEHKNFDYIRKLGIIRESIFGIDIQPIATEIARLRCFLTLIVDERVDDDEVNRGVYALPNLDFKFVTANSLVPLGVTFSDKSEQTGLFEDTSGISELKSLRDDYFNSHNSERDALKFKFSQSQNRMLQNIIKSNSKGLAETTQKLSSWDPFSNQPTSWFDADWMFGLSQGFDIVIGNPPYGVSVKGDYRKTLSSQLGKVPDYEIYYYFIRLSRNLLKSGGINAYIIPNTFLFNVYALTYRISLLNKWQLELILDCTAFKLFESATVRNAIVIFRSNDTGSSNIGYKQTKDADSFAELSNRPTLTVAKNDLMISNTNWGLIFKLPRENIEIISKLKSSRYVVNDLFPEISQGLIAYDKYQGQSQEIIKSRAYHYLEKTRDDLKEWLWGEDVTPYKVKWNGKEYINYGTGIANPRDPKFFKGERLLVREITNPKIFAGFTDIEMYHDPALIVVLNNENNILPLVGILNSKVASFYHFNSSPKATKGAFPKILVKDIKEFPVPQWDKAKVLIPLVKEILDAKTSSPNLDTSEIETKIDQLVYRLYNLTSGEIAIVESSLNGKESPQRSIS